VPAAVPSQVSPTASQVFFDSETIELQLEYSGAVMDASDVALLRQYSSEQTQILIVEELQRRAPGVVVPRNDIPPHPNSPQARVLHLTVPDHGKPVKSPAYTPGEIWQ
jgi:hypothetical protein